MTLLNAMFAGSSIAACNYFSAVAPISGMPEKYKHDSLRRLLEATARRGISSHSALAEAMGESEQVITNWAARGISASGAIKAQKVFGVSPLWVLEGIGSSDPLGYSPEALALAWTLDQITDRLAKRRAETQASAILLAAIQQIESTPTDTPARRSAPSKQF